MLFLDFISILDTTSDDELAENLSFFEYRRSDSKKNSTAHDPMPLQPNLIGGFEVDSDMALLCQSLDIACLQFKEKIQVAFFPLFSLIR